MSATPLLHYSKIGQGAPLVLIHGLFGSADNLLGIARALADVRTIYNVDVRNHGASFHSPDWSFTSMANDITALLDHEGLPQVDVLGHSMGGKIAMALALHAPERVSKLVVADISPVASLPRHQQIIAGLKAVAEARLSSRNDANQLLSQYVAEIGVRQFLLKSLASNQGVLHWKFNIADIDVGYPQILTALTSATPFSGDTLFIKGGESDYVQREHMADILQLFPNAQAKVIQGAGHWLHAEKPVAFNKIVRDFLLR